MKKSKDTLLDESERRSDKLISAEKQLVKTLDSLLEGVQIIDFHWQYVYINDILAGYENTTKEKLLGTSVKERYPGIEHTEVLAAMEQCMMERTRTKIETEYLYPDHSKKWFELNIEPVEEGIRVLSLDITARKEADDKIKRANRLYSFISQVNQNIVRVKDEATLFHNACSMALDFGKFKMAWIGLFDFENRKITLADQSGIPPEDIKLFVDTPLEDNGPQDYVIRSGTNYICNDIALHSELTHWNSYAAKHGIRSCMVVPIRKSGDIIGTFNLYAAELNFLETEEINLLVEVTSDISFALDLLEKEKKHNATEELIVKNEKQFRHTLDQMLEGVQIHDYNWRYIYVNDALVSYSTFTRENLLGYTLMEKYPGIEQTPLFEALQRCMTSREAEQLETEFVFPDGSKRHFELSIQPIPEGISILSFDRSEQKKAKDKLEKVNRLYAFISAINQSIVHLTEEQELLDNACSIAVDIGEFKMGWIDLVDEQTGKVNMVSTRGATVLVETAQKYSGMDYDSPLLAGTPTGRALHTGHYAVSNDVQHDPAMAPWRTALIENNIRASISLPIRMGEKVVGVFGLHSATEHFFDEQEILLLKEATGDISFALENFDRVKRHKVTEELVIQNEIRFRALIEKSADMITLVTAEGELIYGSPFITKVLGYPLEEILHKHDQQFIHPDDVRSFATSTAQLLQTPAGSFSSQQRLRHKNGTWVWCEGTVTNMLHQPGVHAIVSNFRDISEKKAMEQQQEFNRSNLNALINNTADLMWSVDKNFNLITSNTPFDEAIKYARGEAIPKGGTVLDAEFPQDQLNHFRGLYERAFTGEVFTEIEYTPHPETWMAISYFPITRNDEVIGTACHCSDISAIKKAEQKLRLSESFNRGILNALRSQIAVIDGLGNIVAVNNSWRRFTEEHPNTILQDTGIGDNYFDVCRKAETAGDQTASRILEGMKGVMNDQDVFYFEYPSPTPTSQQWSSMRVMKFDSIEPMIVVAHEDISDRKLAEENLIQNNGELQKTNAELDRFVYSASHDLRAPLCSILGLVSLIEMRSKEPDTLEYTTMIRNSVNRLDEFLQNILRYSKNNRLELEISHIPLQKTIGDILNALRNMKEAVGMIFDIDIEEQQPFYCDAHRFNIILENLISNAIKFQDYSRTERFIKITGTSDKENLNIEITDNGIGIATEHQPKIFDMFFRISGERYGSGIGLYIVKEAILKLQGSIAVNSKEHTGTTFYVRLKNMIS